MGAVFNINNMENKDNTNGFVALIQLIGGSIMIVLGLQLLML